MKKDKIVQSSDKVVEDGLMTLRPSLDKRGFFAKMGDVYEEDLFPKDWDAEKIAKASQELVEDRRFSSGFWAQIPKICGIQCRNHKFCRLSSKPYDERCPEEIAFLELLMRKYMQDLKVTMDDIGNVSLIRDLCDIEIQIIRKQGILATQDLIMEEPILDSRGDPTDYVRYVENPAIGSQNKLFDKKHAILKMLVATRESRMKAEGDQSKKNSDMAKATQALKELRKLIEAGQRIDKDVDMQDDFIDATFEVVEPDDDPEE
jgi:ElaB/YqjD/DUF883 family membrane-anchored ribosome-binding protein